MTQETLDAEIFAVLKATYSGASPAQHAQALSCIRNLIQAHSAEPKLTMGIDWSVQPPSELIAKRLDISREEFDSLYRTVQRCYECNSTKRYGTACARCNPELKP